MNTTPSDETILKTDVLGRVKTPADRREQLLDEFERSGLSGQQFAELVGVKYQTFATWAQKRRRQHGAYKAVKAPAQTADQVRWLEAVVEQAQNSVGQNPLALLLELPGGARVEIRDAKQTEVAAALLRALEKSC
jgi:hypothetical protein